MQRPFLSSKMAYSQAPAIRTWIHLGGGYCSANRSAGLQVRGPELSSSSAWPWLNDLTSLRLPVLICKRGLYLLLSMKCKDNTTHKHLAAYRASASTEGMLGLALPLAIRTSTQHTGWVTLCSAFREWDFKARATRSLKSVTKDD